jgi:predicted lipoprotein with Yx(FWY)xxD motif
VRTLAITVLSAATFATACGSASPASGPASSPSASSSESPTPTPSPVPTTAPTAAATAAATPAAVVIGTASVSGAGTVLVDPRGFTLYRFVPESGGKAVCTGGCAGTWPPLKVGAGATVSSSASLPGKLGTITLPDGTREATYNNWPLHTFSGDSAPGQDNGQGIGGQWFAVTPSTM